MVAGSKPFFTFVYGPTASGKSAWSIKQCLELSKQGHRCAIVNGDSLQVYKNLLIGSASPSPAEKALVPHFLYNYKEAGTELTVGDYHRDFYSLLPTLTSDFDQVFVVGGSGFYLQSVFFGLFEVGASDSELRSKIENELKDPELEKQYFQELTLADPEIAAKIHPNDHYRLARFLEIVRTTGKTVSELHRKHREAGVVFDHPFKLVLIDRERGNLEQVVLNRTSKMFESGWVQEVQTLLDRGFFGWSALQSVGYRELVTALQESHLITDLDILTNEIKTSTLKLIKKQRTWARRWEQDDRLIDQIIRLTLS